MKDYLAWSSLIVSILNLLFVLRVRSGQKEFYRLYNQGRHLMAERERANHMAADWMRKYHELLSKFNMNERARIDEAIKNK